MSQRWLAMQAHISVFALQCMSRCKLTKSVPVDSLPICQYANGAHPTLWLKLSLVKYLPIWFPGAGFKRQAAKWKLLVDQTFFRPFNELKSALASIG